MALTKEVKYDKIEVVGDYKAVQCRRATVVSEVAPDDEANAVTNGAALAAAVEEELVESTK